MNSFKVPCILSIKVCLTVSANLYFLKPFSVSINIFFPNGMCQGYWRENISYVYIVFLCGEDTQDTFIEATAHPQ
jgi:hypothetical protein